MISVAILQPHSLETGDKWPPPPSPIILSFVWDWEGAQKCFILCNQTTGDLKSHHLTTRVTLTALSVPPRAPLLSAELWVICYHLGNLGIMCIPNYALPYILAISYNARKFIFLGHLRPFQWGGGGGSTPLGQALSKAGNQTMV